MKKILVIGTTCVDIILTMDHLPVTEEDINPDSQTITVGGCAYNTANIIRQAGIPLTLASPVGSGVYGDYVAAHLAKTGFPIFVREPAENGCCYCLVEKSGERTFLSYHGVEYSFRRSWMNKIQPEEYGYVYFCGLEVEEPTGSELIAYLEDTFKGRLFFSPGPRLASIPKDRLERILDLAPVLHINRHELALLSGCEGLEEGMYALRERTGNTVIVTLGEQGACFLESSTHPEINAGRGTEPLPDNALQPSAACSDQTGGLFTVPGIPSEVVDTIGAGDAHAGQVLASLALGKTIAEAVSDANLVSSRVVSVKGASLTDDQYHSLFTVPSGRSKQPLP